MLEKENTEIKIQNSVEITDLSVIEKIKTLLKESYKCTFKLSDKRNPYFNDLEVAKGDFIYKRILVGKDDVKFELQFTSEIIDILHQRPLMPSEVESINNKNFSRHWTVNEKKTFELIKKGYLFEVRLSVRNL